MTKLKVPFVLNQKGGVVNSVMSLLRNLSNENEEKKKVEFNKDLQFIGASKTKDLFSKKKIKIKTRTKIIKKNKK